MLETSNCDRRNNKIMRTLCIIALGLALHISGSAQVLADASSMGPAKIEIGKRETTKYLIGGAWKKIERKYIITRYRIFASPKNVVSYVFVVQHADGSTETFPAEEEVDHPNFDRVFTGTNLALKIVRKSDDNSYPIEMRYFLHTRVEGEDGVWR
jgi:hypothetical protein